MSIYEIQQINSLWYILIDTIRIYTHFNMEKKNITQTWWLFTRGSHIYYICIKCITYFIYIISTQCAKHITYLQCSTCFLYWESLIQMENNLNGEIRHWRSARNTVTGAGHFQNIVGYPLTVLFAFIFKCLDCHIYWHMFSILWGF